MEFTEGSRDRSFLKPMVSQSWKDSGAHSGGVRHVSSLSRFQLLGWLNQKLGTYYIRLEQLADGIAYSAILDAIYPGKIPLHQIDYNARSPADFLRNMRILSASLKKTSATHNFDAFKISQANYAENFRFTRWLYTIYENHCRSDTPVKNLVNEQSTSLATRRPSLRSASSASAQRIEELLRQSTKGKFLSRTQSAVNYLDSSSSANRQSRTTSSNADRPEISRQAIQLLADRHGSDLRTPRSRKNSMGRLTASGNGGSLRVDVGIRTLASDEDFRQSLIRSWRPTGERRGSGHSMQSSSSLSRQQIESVLEEMDDDEVRQVETLEKSRPFPPNRVSFFHTASEAAAPQQIPHEEQSGRTEGQKMVRNLHAGRPPPSQPVPSGTSSQSSFSAESHHSHADSYDTRVDQKKGVEFRQPVAVDDPDVTASSEQHNIKSGRRSGEEASKDHQKIIAECQQAIVNLKEQILDRLNRQREMGREIAAIEHERNFYFEKLTTLQALSSASLDRTQVAADVLLTICEKPSDF